MEYLLLPHYRGDPPTQIPKVPYVSTSRYDGTPFLSYPAKAGMPHAHNVLDDDDVLNYRLVEHFNPTPIRELESFMQTWLFFGFIAEAICATGEDESRTVGEGYQPRVQEEIRGMTCSEICDYIYEMICVLAEDGAVNVVLDGETANKFVALAKTRWPTDRGSSQMRFDYMRKCLQLMVYIVAALPMEFNTNIRASIVAIFEFIGVELTEFASDQGLQHDHFSPLVPQYYDNEVRNDMIRHGWCPNDIARISQTLPSQQLAHIARMMDKSLPKKDHSMCSEFICRYLQIDMTNYQLLHHHGNCTCEKVQVSSSALTEILEDGDTIVLLRFVGAVENLRVELVKSSKDTPYVAISHVWADGLGNPFENSLHRCKLNHLRNLVSRMCPSVTPDNLLIWLDTLCCPSQDGLGKRLALQKLRFVYRNADRVLVIDKGLMAYDSQRQEPAEKAMRIFTSAWNRRLWTLQEGALAESLWFQFADEAVALSDLHLEIQKLAINSTQYANIYLHTLTQFLHFQAFITEPEKLPATVSRLSLLREALLHRGVTVATDEPLCIGTLMHLDLAKILAAERKEKRMEKVWELFGESEDGIPASIIFLEETKISTPGWRWALKSLLHSEPVLMKLIISFPDDHGYKRASIVPGGLKVTYPGYQIKVREYGDGKPRNPWPGLRRLLEYPVIFRDDSLQKFFRVMDKARAMYDGDGDEYKNLLHHLADGNNSALVVDALSSFDGKSVASAVFGLTVDSDDALAFSGEVEKAIKIEAKYRVILSPCKDNLCYIFDIFSKCAIQARSHELTNNHLAIYSRLQGESGESSELLQTRVEKDEEFHSSKLALIDYFEAMMKKVVQEDERFVKAVTIHLGSEFIEFIWKMVPGWCSNNYVGERLSEEQVWIVD
jgi:hypothetical protein